MYKIIGADGKEYGPIPADTLKKWIAEGRANAQTKVLPEGATEWLTVAQLPELAAAMPTIAPLPAAAPSMAAPGLSPNANQLNGPAIGLIVTGALYVLLALFRIGSAVLGVGFGTSFAEGNPELQKMMAMSGTINGALGVFGLMVAGLVLWGGIKMRKLERYGMSMTAAIIALLPCTFPCCCIGLPIGIWALVVLMKPEVKAQFH